MLRGQSAQVFNYIEGDEMEKRLGGEYVYNGKIVNVRVDDVEVCGRKTIREVCEHPGGVAVLPLLDSGEVICVKQFRYAFGKELLEIPAGKLEYGEEPLSCGIRELSEETGYSAKEIIPLGVLYPSPGYLTEKLYIYLARGLSEGEAHPDEGEFLQVVRKPLDELYKMVMQDEIHDAKTSIAILKTKAYLKK